MVTVFRPERQGGDHQAPIPEVLLEQRERLNNLACLGPPPPPVIEPAERHEFDPNTRRRASLDACRLAVSKSQNQDDQAR